MQIVYQFFPQILDDNDVNYFSHLQGIVDSIDEFAQMEISKFPESYSFRLVPSLPLYTNSLIQELIKFHNLFSIHLDMSKSIKSSSTIFFKINLL